MGKRGASGRRMPVLEESELGGGLRVERRDAAESRRRVLGVARALFEEKGVDAVSMHEIGRAAGVGQGTLYRRYEHKGALCAALLREEIEGFSREVRSRVEEGGETALSDLAWFLERLAGFNEENAPLLGAIGGSAGRRGSGMYRSAFYGWLRQAVATLLRRAVEEGEAAPDLDAECLADAILAPLNVELYLFQRRELGMERGRILRAVRGLLLDGVRGTAATDEP